MVPGLFRGSGVEIQRTLTWSPTRLVEAASLIPG
jgi:hypothetical protein